MNTISHIDGVVVKTGSFPTKENTSQLFSKVKRPTHLCPSFSSQRTCGLHIHIFNIVHVEDFIKMFHALIKTVKSFKF